MEPAFSNSHMRWRDSFPSSGGRDRIAFQSMLDECLSTFRSALAERIAKVDAELKETPLKELIDLTSFTDEGRLGLVPSGVSVWGPRASII